MHSARSSFLFAAGLAAAASPIAYWSVATAIVAAAARNRVHPVDLADVPMVAVAVVAGSLLLAVPTGVVVFRRLVVSRPRPLAIAASTVLAALAAELGAGLLPWLLALPPADLAAGGLAGPEPIFTVGRGYGPTVNLVAIGFAGLLGVAGYVGFIVAEAVGAVAYLALGRFADRRRAARIAQDLLAALAALPAFWPAICLYPGLAFIALAVGMAIFAQVVAPSRPTRLPDSPSAAGGGRDGQSSRRGGPLVRRGARP